MRTLGFDTSNYTTSVAAFNGVSGENCSRLLDVRPGELGLRQSDALFAHVKRLPEMTDELFAALPRDTIRAVGASTRPRAVDGSYMPCFLAGSSQAQTLARMAAAVERQLSLSRQRLEALAGKRVLQSPMNYLQDKRMTLEYSRERLSSASQRLMQAKREQFVRLTAKLDAMSPLKVLSRGYSVVRTEDGSVLRRAADARLGDRIQIDLMQGTLLAEVSQVLEAEDA